MLGSVIESVSPAVKIVEGPLQRFDQLLCGGLDVVEHRVPIINLPPQMVCIEYTLEYLHIQFLIVSNAISRFTAIQRNICPIFW